MPSGAPTELKYSWSKRESSLTWASHAGVEGPQQRSACRLVRRRTTVTKKNICLLWNQGTLSNSASSLVSTNPLLSAGNVGTCWRRTRNRPPASKGRGAGPNLYYLTAQALWTKSWNQNWHQNILIGTWCQDAVFCDYSLSMLADGTRASLKTKPIHISRISPKR